MPKVFGTSLPARPTSIWGPRVRPRSPRTPGARVYPRTRGTPGGHGHPGSPGMPGRGPQVYPARTRQQIYDCRLNSLTLLDPRRNVSALLHCTQRIIYRSRTGSRTPGPDFRLIVWAMPHRVASEMGLRPAPPEATRHERAPKSPRRILPGRPRTRSSIRRKLQPQTTF